MVRPARTPSMIAVSSTSTAPLCLGVAAGVANLRPRIGDDQQRHGLDRIALLQLHRRDALETEAGAARANRGLLDVGVGGRGVAHEEHLLVQVGASVPPDQVVEDPRRAAAPLIEDVQSGPAPGRRARKAAHGQREPAVVGCRDRQRDHVGHHQRRAHDQHDRRPDRQHRVPASRRLGRETTGRPACELTPISPRSATARRTSCPAPTRVSNVRSPACFSRMIVRAIARPWPVPRPTSLVVKKGSKIRERISSGMPQPSSLTEMMTSSPRCCVLTRINPRRPRVLDDVADGVRGVDHQVQDDLVDVVDVASDGGDVAELGLQVGHVLVLVGRDDQRALDGAVEIDRRHLVRPGVRELLHRADDPRDALQPLERALERLRHVLAQVVEVGALGGLRRRRHRGVELGRARAAVRDQRLQRLQRVDQLERVARRFPQEVDAVADELHRRVDLVRHAGRQRADRRQPLRRHQLDLRDLRFGHVLAQHHGGDDLAAHADRTDVVRHPDRTAVRLLERDLVELVGAGREDLLERGRDPLLGARRGVAPPGLADDRAGASMCGQALLKKRRLPSRPMVAMKAGAHSITASSCSRASSSSFCASSERCFGALSQHRQRRVRADRIEEIDHGVIRRPPGAPDNRDDRQDVIVALERDGQAAAKPGRPAPGRRARCWTAATPVPSRDSTISQSGTHSTRRSLQARPTIPSPGLRATPFNAEVNRSSPRSGAHQLSTQRISQAWPSRVQTLNTSHPSSLQMANPIPWQISTSEPPAAEIATAADSKRSRASAVLTVARVADSRTRPLSVIAPADSSPSPPSRRLLSAPLTPPAVP